MTGWLRIPLGEIFDIARGGSPRPIDDYITDANNGINWVSISDASDSSKYIERTKRRIRPEGASRSRVVRPGDFLLTNSMSFGRPYIMRTTGCIHDGWLALGRKRADVDQDFFFHLLGSEAVYAEFARLASGVTVKNLNIDLVKGVHVPVPPLADQRRIAGILDQVDALKAKRREALAQLDRLTQSIFVEMFGDLTTNPKRWGISQLKDIFEIARGGSPRPIDDFITEDRDGANWIMIGDAPAGSKYITSTRKRIRAEGVKRSRLVKPGDFLLTNSMSFGKPYIMQTTGCIHDGWLVLSPRNGEFDSDFFYCLLGSQAIYREFERRAAGATVKNLNIDLVGGVFVPIPPLARQQEFAHAEACVEALRTTHRKSLTELDQLFVSLQHAAFRGEL